MNTGSRGHDLLLLTLSLAQVDSQEKIASLFVEAMSGLFSPTCFRFLDSPPPPPNKGFPLQTIRKTYGWIVVSDDAHLDEEQRELLWNAVQMLAIIIERSEHSRLLSTERERLSQAVCEKTSELQRMNEELRETNVQLQTEITRHRQTTDELRQSETLLAQAQQIAHVGSWTLDLISGQLSWSDETYRIFGLKPQEVIATYEGVLEATHPDDRMTLDTAYTGSVREGTGHYEIEHRIIRRDTGEIRYVLEKCRHERDASGVIIRSIGMVQDITEQKNAEEALRKSQAMLSSILDTIPQSVFWKNREGVYLGCNRRFAQDVGLMETQQVIGKTDFDMPWPREEAEAYLADDREVLEHNRSKCHIVEPLQQADGSRVWIDTTKIPLINEDGVPFAVLGVYEDISERKAAATALAEEKERLAVTLRSIGDGVITTDTQGNVIIMNRVAEELTGWKQSEAVGKPLTIVFRIVNEGTRQPCENPAEKVLASREIIELANHTLLLSRDGTERSIADSGAPITDTNGVIIGVVLVFRDMTEKQKLLHALQRTDKLDALGVLAGGIAHDFNNLLAGIFGYIDIARETTTEEVIADYLSKALTVFSRAKDLTQQLLAFSKGGAPKRQTGSIVPLIRECTSFALSGARIACDLDLAEELWPVDFDRNQIGQVIDNLLINAQQAMPLGGRISFAARNVVLQDGEMPPLKAGKYTRMSVTDTGTGIPPEILPRIFDPFFTTKQKGSGLGLATCYAIVQRHDGCIEVESVMGTGTTFHVFLPASLEATIHGQAETSVSHRGTGKVLIMDDEPFIREILRRFLGEMGYTVCEAANGEEALRVCAEVLKKEKTIDLAFFDLTIPGGMSGKETVVQLRKLFPEALVFVSSGYSEDPVMARPTAYGFADSIRKPYRKDELASLLNRHLVKTST